MLVALALMAVVSIALYGSLRAGFRARRSVDAALASAGRARSALQIVHRDLTAAVPPVGVLAGAFVGEDVPDAATGRQADVLTWFAAVGRPQQGAGDIVKLQLTLGEATGQSSLVRRSTRNLLAPKQPDPVEEVLCRGVTSLNLRYFDGSSWLDAWDSTAQGNSLPLAVEVSVEIAPDGSRGPEAKPDRLVRVVALPCASLPADADRAIRNASG